MVQVVLKMVKYLARYMILVGLTLRGILALLLLRMLNVELERAHVVYCVERADALLFQVDLATLLN